MSESATTGADAPTESIDQTTTQIDGSQPQFSELPSPVSRWGDEYDVYQSLLPFDDRDDDPIAAGLAVAEAVDNLPEVKRTFTIPELGLEYSPETIETILRAQQVPVYNGLPPEDPTTTDPSRIKYWNVDHYHYPTEADPLTDADDRLRFLDCYGPYCHLSTKWVAKHYGIEPNSVTHFIRNNTPYDHLSEYSESHRPPLARTAATIREWTDYSYRDLSTAFGLPKSSLHKWINTHTENTGWSPPPLSDQSRPVFDWAETDVEVVKAQRDEANRRRRRLCHSEWAAHHGVNHQLLPLRHRLYDPLAAAITVRETIEGFHEFQETWTIGETEDDTDLGRFDAKIRSQLLRLHGVIVYDDDTRPKRFYNPEYHHYDHQAKPITDTDDRLRIYDEHTALGVHPVEWYCDHFGLTAAELRDFAVEHDRRPPEEAVRAGRRRLGRTLYTAIQWSPWDIGSIADAIDQPPVTVRKWIHEAVFGGDPNSEPVWQPPRRPVGKEWFSDPPAPKKYDREDVRFWEADTLPDRIRNKQD